MLIKKFNSTKPDFFSGSESLLTICYNEGVGGVGGLGGSKYQNKVNVFLIFILVKLY